MHLLLESYLQTPPTFVNMLENLLKTLTSDLMKRNNTQFAINTALKNVDFYRTMTTLFFYNLLKATFHNYLVYLTATSVVPLYFFMPDRYGYLCLFHWIN